MLIDGQVQELKSNGTFETDFYVPRSGKTIEIVAYDKKGNKASKLLKLKRGDIQQASGPSFDALNPSVKRVKSNPNALALIIGVANYEKTPANALYADKDAQQFYDYATMKLGIPYSNIKELVNDKADLGEILINVKIGYAGLLNLINQISIFTLQVMDWHHKMELRCIFCHMMEDHDY